ncbi:MAG: hypothetical protein EBU69_05215, partial [Methylophilaceae bacterium]|nr:hypothetical protein [Methylophilaceae bacterium]
SGIWNSSGNVGIGTTSPGAKLQIGSGLTSDTFHIGSAANNTDGLFYGGYVNGLLIGKYNTNPWAGTTLPDNSVGIGGAAYIMQGLHIGSVSDPGNDNLVVDGVTGIGTTTPLGLLNVASTLPYIYITDTNAATDNKHWFMENNAGLLSFGTTSDALGVSATRAMSITNTGNVGIGTTTPGAKLDVDGFIRSLSGATAPTSGLGVELRYNPSAGYGGILTYDRSTSTYYPSKVEGSTVALRISGSDKLFVDTNGNIGLGTTTPSQTLSVQGNGLFSGDITAANIIATGTLTVGSLSSTGALSATSLTLSNIGRDMILTSDGSGVLTSSSTPTAAAYLATSTTATSTFAGNVYMPSGYFAIGGMPKTNGGYTSGKLQVIGTDIFVDNGHGITSTSHTSAVMMPEDSDTLSKFAAYGGHKFLVWDGSNYTEQMRITGGSNVGNVGIGTTTPAARLGVQGNGLFSG